ncbi:bicaudal-D-related protein 2-like [Osmerus eperlanus]|uniref:bicaudal-D-related protein 2-like n=1 Tax=Osmerus eperlanus TaxID=29151 RepID=UPI002E11C384
MEESVSFSVLNQRLRPKLTAMERLCYSLEDQSHTPDSIRGSPTTRPTMLTHLEPQVNESLTGTQEEKDDPEQEEVTEEEEQEEVDSDGSTPQDVCAESLTAAGDCLFPCPTIECLELNDSTTVTDCCVPTLTMEGDCHVGLLSAMEGEGPDGMITVREGDGCDPGEAVREGESLSQMSYIERALPDLISSGRPLTRRRTLGPVSDTLKEVRREVELSRRRSLRLKAQVDKLQENKDGPRWGQHKEKVTEEVLSVLRLLLPLTETESMPVEPLDQENRLDSALIKLQNVARKLTISHTAQDSKCGSRKGKGVEDSSVFQQALRDRDEAMEKKKAMEAELLRSKTEMMSLNNHLLEEVQKRLEMSLELEAWKEDVQIILHHHLQSQQQAEECQKKPSRSGLLRRNNKPPIQRPGSMSVSNPSPKTRMVFSSNPTPSTPVHTPSPKPVPVPTPSPAPTTKWKKIWSRGKSDRPCDQNDRQESQHSKGSSRENEGFHNVALD